MKRILIAALIAGAWANTAIAENFDWSGIYGGVSVGARWSDMDYRSPYGMVHDYWSTSGTGVTAGAFLGYNFTYGNVVFGPDINVSFSDANGDSETEYSGSWYQNDKQLRTKATASANMRVGYAFDRILPYITGGYSKSWYDLTYTTRAITNLEWSDEFNRSGWNIGAGTDWAITSNLFARAEYRFIDLGKEDLNGSSGWSRKFKQHAATLGIGYKF